MTVSLLPRTMCPAFMSRRLLIDICVVFQSNHFQNSRNWYGKENDQAWQSAEVFDPRPRPYRPSKERVPPSYDGYQPPRCMELGLQVPETQCVAMDCEMVGVGPQKRSVLARVSIVNFDGDTLFDTFVKVEEKVTDYRTFVSGIRPADLESSNAMSFGACRSKVVQLLEGKVLVGHALSNDFKVLGIGHCWHHTRDTSMYAPFMKTDYSGSYKPRRLRELTRIFLGKSIQEAEHCSLEDAKATMELYKLVKSEWDYATEVAARRFASFNEEGYRFSLPNSRYSYAHGGQDTYYYNKKYQVDSRKEKKRTNSGEYEFNATSY